MKKFTKFLMAALAVLMLAFPLMACEDDEQGGGGKEADITGLYFGLDSPMSYDIIDLKSDGTFVYYHVDGIRPEMYYFIEYTGTWKSDATDKKRVTFTPPQNTAEFIVADITREKWTCHWYNFTSAFSRTDGFGKTVKDLNITTAEEWFAKRQVASKPKEV